MKNRSSSIILSLFCAVLLVIASERSFASEDPIQMMQGLSSRVMGALKQNRSELQRNPNKVYEVVNRYILPSVDFVEMARWVVGRNAWQQADAATQKRFVDEFKNLVIRSYAQSLMKYTDQTVDFLPLRGSAAGKERVQVSSFVRESGKKAVRIDYRLLRAGGSWKVYDIIIEGVSLMQGYRAQFSDDIRQGGVKAVVNKLHQHNRGGKR